jgi:hypothetical protein
VLVDQPLVGRVEALDRRVRAISDDRVHGLVHALADVAVTAVAQLDRLEGAGGGTGLGTAARAKDPSSSSTSTSTVGLPRESRISRAPTASMVLMDLLVQ